MISSNDRTQRIIDATGEVESDEELARIVGEGLLQVLRSGQRAWEALFEMLDSTGEDQVAEFKARFFEWSETENTTESSIE